MKYNFDESINRTSDPYSFSMKWKSYGYAYRKLNVTLTREDLICLETADMDIKVAPEILEDLHKLTDHGILGYSVIPQQYKEAVCSWYKKRQDWEFSPEDIIYAPGTHTAVFECVKRCTNENDGVIVITPCYGYHSDVEPNNRRYICVDMINDGNEYFTLDVDALEKACADPTNTMLILCHPHNPTGRVYSEEELKIIADITKRHNVLVVSDEVHSDILRKGQKFIPYMKVGDPSLTITCTAVNKTFNLAGLSMTNIVITDANLKAKFEDYFMLPTPYGIQAVISAYTRCEQWVDELNAYFDESIDECIEYVHTHLPKAHVWRPEGGYSINIDFTGYGLSDDEVSQRIYGNAGVILNSGYFFDDKRKGQVHRACLSSPKALCLEALERIAKEFE